MSARFTWSRRTVVDWAWFSGSSARPTKSNEITAIPELLDALLLKGAIVTIDAAGCQQSIAQKIVDGAADYVLAVRATGAR